MNFENAYQNKARRYDFGQMLEFSKGIAADTVEQTIVQMLPGCTSCAKSTIVDDKTGIDYWAVLNGGVEVGIDLKLRQAGCSRYWKHGPELALETWSVMPDRQHVGRKGWTLDETKTTDYTLHIFDKRDTDVAYLMPFQALRIAFQMNHTEWKKSFRVAEQDSGRWKSQCVFVPVSVVWESMQMTSQHVNLDNQRRLK